MNKKWFVNGLFAGSILTIIATCAYNFLRENVVVEGICDGEDCDDCCGCRCDSDMPCDEKCDNSDKTISFVEGFKSDAISDDEHTKSIEKSAKETAEAMTKAMCTTKKSVSSEKRSSINNILDQLKKCDTKTLTNDKTIESEDEE